MKSLLIIAIAYACGSAAFAADGVTNATTYARNLTNGWARLQEAQDMEQKGSNYIGGFYGDAAVAFLRAWEYKQTRDIAYALAYCYARSGAASEALKFAKEAQRTDTGDRLDPAFIKGATRIANWAQAEIKRYERALREVQRQEEIERSRRMQSGSTVLGQAGGFFIPSSMPKSKQVPVPKALSTNQR